MPNTKKGKKILHKMEEEYGAKKGESVFYASIEKGKLKGTGTKTEARKRGKKVPKK